MDAFENFKTEIAEIETNERAFIAEQLNKVHTTPGAGEVFDGKLLLEIIEAAMDVVGANAANASTDNPGEQEAAISAAEDLVSVHINDGSDARALATAIWLWKHDTVKAKVDALCAKVAA